VDELDYCQWAEKTNLFLRLLVRRYERTSYINTSNKSLGGYLTI
jgi:hypothetical protein